MIATDPNWAEIESAHAAIAMVAVTLLAFAAAGWAAWAAFRIYKLERGRDDIAREDRVAAAESARRAQAELIAVWPMSEPGSIGYPNGGIGTTTGPQVAWATAVNSSALPVYELAVTFAVPQDPDRMRRESRLAIMAPGTHLVGERTKTVPGGAVMGQIADGEPYAVGSGGYRFDVSIEFRDAAGVQWMRSATGVLSERT